MPPSAGPPTGPRNFQETQHVADSTGVSPSGPTRPGRRLSAEVRRRLAEEQRRQAQQQPRDAVGQFVARRREPDRPRTGLRSLRAAVRARGLAALDGRSRAARALGSWGRELLSDQGGEHASAAQKALVELAVRGRLLLDHVDAHLLERSSLVERRGRRLLPLVEQRQRLAEHLVRILGTLGLERRARPVLPLNEYLAQKYPAKPATGAVDGTP